MPYFKSLKSYSYRNAPKKLIPAIIACKCVPYLIVLGFFVCLSGFIPLLVKKELNTLSIPSINETSTISYEELTNITRQESDSWTQKDMNFICKYILKIFT